MKRLLLTVLLLAVGAGLFPARAAAAAAAVPAAAPATATDGRVLILPFNNSTGRVEYDALQEGLADILTTAVRGVKGLAVIEREQLSLVLAEQRLALQGLTSRDAAAGVGKLLGARIILTGGFMVEGEEILVNGHLYDIESAALIKSAEVRGKIGELVQTAMSLTTRLLEKDGLRSGDSSLQQLRQNIGNITADVNFVRGLNFYYVSQYDQAIAEFMSALRAQPKSAEARFWNARSYYAQGEWAHAVIELRRFARDIPDHSRLADVREMLTIAEGRLSPREKDLLDSFSGAPVPAPAQ